MSARWWTSGVWALAAGSGLYWGLQVFVKPQAAPAYTQTAAADERFQLIGVVSPPSRQAAREGVALIAVDGRPAKAFRVGAVVEGDTVLQTVAARGVTLGPRNGPALVALNLPPPAPASTGTLPNMGGDLPPPPRSGTPYRGAGTKQRSVPPVMTSPELQPGQPMPDPEAQENAVGINQADNLPLR